MDAETPMKTQILRTAAVLFLAIAAAPLFAVQRNAVDEVIRMTKAGVSEETILEYIHKTDARVIVTGDDVIAMTEANVSKNVIKEVVDEADARRVRRDDDGRAYRPRVVIAPSFGYGYYDPYYAYDPFWYRPSVFLNFGFGGYYGGGFRGGSRGGHRGRR
jgi:hypothetical protein